MESFDGKRDAILRCHRSEIGNAMSKLANEIMIPIPCPHCGHEVEESLTKVKTNPEIVCAACGQTFEVANEPSVEVAGRIWKGVKGSFLTRPDQTWSHHPGRVI
jgi:transposase-like protein